MSERASEAPGARRSRVVEASPVYYGWVILIAATVGMVMTIPGQTVGVSAFVDSIIADLGMPRSQVSLLYSVGTLAGSLAMPWVGRWVDLRGPRLAVGVIAAGLTLACLGMSRISGPLTLLLGFTALRGFGQGALGLVSLHVVNLWFVRKRGLAVGLTGIGFAVAGALFPNAAQSLIAEHGWRTSYVVLGILVAATILPLGTALFRERPESFGLLPDGGSADPKAEAAPAEEEWTLPEARRTAMFWLLIVGSLLPAALVTGLTFHHFSIMQRNGLDQGAAATVFVPLAVVSALSNLLSGIVLDRVQPRYVLAAGQALLAVSLLVAPRVEGLGSAYLYGTVLGVTQGMQGAVGGTAWAHYFGRTHYGAIRGFAFSIMVGSSAFGPLPFAWGLETFGSYAPVLTASALLPVAATVWAFFVPEPRRAPTAAE
ncbi:MAG: MFS transporter [Armatimonadota bacterium]